MQALESALRLETDLRVHGDAVIGARLNLLIKAAPDVGAEPRPIDREGLAQVIYDASYGRPGVDLTYANKNEVRVALAYAVADAVLRYIGAQTAQPVEPKPEPAQLPVCARCGRFACGCEPAKVRVKLPPRSDYSPSSKPSTTTNWKAGFDAGIDACAKSLRSQGVEVDDA